MHRLLSTLPLFAALLCGSLAGEAAAEPFRLIVSDTETPLVPNSVMELAMQGGYFERAGVEVEFVRVGQSPMIMAALRAGEGEMANLSLESLLQAVAGGAGDLRAVVSPNTALPYLIAGQGVQDVEGLAGKRFAIGRVGSVDHLLALRVLEAAGLDTKGLDLVALGQPQARAQALVAGQIDATTMSIGSFTAIDDVPGVRVLVDVDAFYAAAPILSKVNVVTSRTLATRGPEVEAVIEALLLAARDYRADPQAWVRAMQTARPDVDLEDLEMLARAFSRSWQVDGGLTAQALTAAQDWLHQGEDFEGISPAPLGAFADLAPLDAVLARIGRVGSGDMAAP